jgi:prephenate dehydrogenase
VTTGDVGCSAVPVPAAAGAIRQYAGCARTAIVGLTGTMETPLAAMEAAAPACERASLHPLFAPANEPGNIPTVVDSGGPRIDTVRTTLEARGNDVFETTAARHDEMMETVQARTHTAVLAFALAASSVPDEYHTPISSELATLATQVTGGEKRVYADIQYAFDGADATFVRDFADTWEKVMKLDRFELE